MKKKGMSEGKLKKKWRERNKIKGWRGRRWKEKKKCC